VKLFLFAYVVGTWCYTATATPGEEIDTVYFKYFFSKIKIKLVRAKNKGLKCGIR